MMTQISSLIRLVTIIAEILVVKERQFGATLQILIHHGKNAHQLELQHFQLLKILQNSLKKGYQVGEEETEIKMTKRTNRKKREELMLK